MKDVLNILKRVFKSELVVSHIIKHYFNKNINKMIKYKLYTCVYLSDDWICGNDCISYAIETKAPLCFIKHLHIKYDIKFTSFNISPCIRTDNLEVLKYLYECGITPKTNWFSIVATRHNKPEFCDYLKEKWGFEPPHEKQKTKMLLSF